MIRMCCQYYSSYFVYQARFPGVIVGAATEMYDNAVMGNNSTIKIGSCVDAFAPGYRLLCHACTDSSACCRPTSNILHIWR